jgi:hypothetical protein
MYRGGDKTEPLGLDEETDQGLTGGGTEPKVRQPPFIGAIPLKFHKKHWQS